MAQHALARRALIEARDSVVRSEGKLARVRLAAAETIERIVQTSEVCGAAFGMGFVDARWAKMTPQGIRPPELVGVPVSLMVGLGLHVAGFAKLAGRASEHLHNIADGTIATYFARLGSTTGSQAIPAATGLPAAARAAAAGSYSDADIAAIAARTLR
jgi:hypothetical protein